MGYLVEGVGDEVLLFGAFLGLSACVTVLVNFWRERTNRERQEQNSQSSSPQHHPEQNTGDEWTLPRSTTSQTEIPREISEGSQLRSRVGHSPGSSESSRNVSGRAEQERGKQERTEGGSLITIRLMMQDNSTRPVQLRTNSTLSEIRRTHFREELSENRPVKFIFQGRVLNNDSSTLEQLNIIDGCPVHVHIGRPRATPQQRVENEQQHANEFLDLSRFFVPLFAMILGIAWVALLCYPDVFSFITKLFLFFLSIGFFLLAYLSTFS